MTSDVQKITKYGMTQSQWVAFRNKATRFVLRHPLRASYCVLVGWNLAHGFKQLNRENYPEALKHFNRVLDWFPKEIPTPDVITQAVERCNKRLGSNT